MSLLMFDHDPLHPFVNPDVSATKGAGSSLNISVTLKSTGSASGFLKMWFRQPSGILTSGTAQPLVPTTASVSFETIATPAGSEPAPMPANECRTISMLVSPSSPAHVTLVWTPPNTTQSISLFFQAADDLNPNGLSDWGASSQLNAQHNTTPTGDG